MIVMKYTGVNKKKEKKKQRKENLWGKECKKGT
jgi:hypothetical protein